MGSREGMGTQEESEGKGSHIATVPLGEVHHMLVLNILCKTEVHVDR